MADPPELRRTGTAALLTFLALILLIAGGVWLFATRFRKRRFVGGFAEF